MEEPRAQSPHTINLTKKMEIHSTAAALLLTFLLLFSNSCNGASEVPAHESNLTAVEFIRRSCEATEYPALCTASLSAHAATIRTSPAELAHAALSVSLASARSASASLTRALAARRPGVLAPRAAAAVRDCVENLGDAVEELRESLAAMGRLGGSGGKDAAYQINSVQTWVSAALTDEDTCMDGFDGGAASDDGEVKEMVRRRVVKVARLLSNALALINCLAPSLSHP